MSRIEELQQQIAALESELHDLQVIEWWQQRPHILEFRCTFTSDYNDDGDYSDYFRPRNIELNEEWIAENKELWVKFCNHSKNYPRPIEPDVDELADDWDFYIRNILDPNDYNYDYPDFQEFDEKIMRNPNYAS